MAKTRNLAIAIIYNASYKKI